MALYVKLREKEEQKNFLPCSYFDIVSQSSNSVCPASTAT